MIRKKSSGRWLVDVQPGGRGQNRIRKTFASKADAQRFERWALSQHQSDDVVRQVCKEKRRLSELVTIWYDTHGRYLKDGERRYRHLLRIAESWGDPVASRIRARDYMEYRAKRTEEGRTAKTCNNELGYLNAVFNELKRVGEINFENPLSSVRPLKVPEREMGYLEHDEIRTLFRELRDNCDNPHVYLVARISLETGARWSEAEGLTRDRIKRYRVTFANTKSGRKRTVPISEDLHQAVTEHLKEWGSFGTSTISAFRRAVKRSGIQLPKGQCAHILRHTFASHFMMNGGNILTLQRILGHASISMTMRYAHLSPDHLEDAVRLNPIGGAAISSELDEAYLY